MATRSYSGNAKTTTLSGAISAAATSISVADGTGYPTGGDGPFVVTLDAGLAAEEKVLVTSRTGNTLSVSSRGWDGTTAADHSNGASVQHTLSATDLREANAHVNETHLSPAGGSTITSSGAAVKGLVIKGAASQTANLIEWQNSAGSNLGHVTSGGSLVLPGTVLAASTTESATHGYSLGLFAATAARVGLVVKGAASQTANLAEFQDSSGVVQTVVTSNGNINMTAATTTLRVGGDVGADARVHVLGTDAARRGLVVKGAASQTANLAEFQNSAGTVLVAVDSGGSIFSAGKFSISTTAGTSTATNFTLNHNDSAKTIEVGAVDSGGAGYRLLRISN